MPECATFGTSVQRRAPHAGPTSGRPVDDCDDERVLGSLDWVAVASVSTAVATLVLALATFSAVRSAHRSARISEQSLAAQLWPLLAPARPEDPEQKVMFQDQHKVMVSGVLAAAEATSDSVYFAIAIRNVGPGLAVLDRWWFAGERRQGDVGHADESEFRRLTRDLYLPPGDVGYWQGAIRDAGSPVRRRRRRHPGPAGDDHRAPLHGLPRAPAHHQPLHPDAGVRGSLVRRPDAALEPRPARSSPTTGRRAATSTRSLSGAAGASREPGTARLRSAVQPSAPHDAEEVRGAHVVHVIDRSAGTPPHRGGAPGSDGVAADRPRAARPRPARRTAAPAGLRPRGPPLGCSRPATCSPLRCSCSAASRSTGRRWRPAR